MVPKPRESWTDDRLDDLKENMDRRFTSLEENMNQRFDAADERVARLDGDVRELRRMMFQGFIAQTTITVSCFVGFVGLFAL
jgi:hypothetical protein